MDRKGGFTLIEILVVILIIGILAGFTGVSVYRHLATAKIQGARLQIGTFRTALNTYRLEQGALPTEEQGLGALCIKPTDPPVPRSYPVEGYLDSRKLPADPWGRPYVYLAPGRNDEPYEILSYGSDGQAGGSGEAADISSAEL